MSALGWFSALCFIALEFLFALALVFYLGGCSLVPVQEHCVGVTPQGPWNCAARLD